VEQFFRQLSQFNAALLTRQHHFPVWFHNYTGIKPPEYWHILYDLLLREDRDQLIVEIGAGYGDVSALLRWMEFRHLTCVERDNSLVSYIEDKISQVCHTKVDVINASYPTKLDFTPDILIQVNCVYAEEIYNKDEYLDSIKETYHYNGVPKVFLFEAIDASYREPNSEFPTFVRLGFDDISSLFPLCSITSHITYQYPKNKITKVLYKICAS
jgi:hypothetical protein